MVDEPLECVISFLCSTNNNVKRITLIVERLCENYGDRIATIDDQNYYSFPTRTVRINAFCVPPSAPHQS